MRKVLYLVLSFFILFCCQYASGQTPCYINGKMFVTDTTCCPAVDSTITFWNDVWGVSSSCPPTIDHWSWNFGDGQTRATSTDTAHHIYSSSGAYTIIATPRDINDSIIGDQYTTQFSHTIVIYTDSQCAECLLINWDFENVLCEYSYTQFHDLSIVPNCDTSDIMYSWNFGDIGSSSNTSTEANPRHVFTADTIYTVKLTITLPQNQTRPIKCTKSLSLQVDAGANMPIFVNVPVLIVSTSPTDINTPVQFEFQGSLVYYDTSQSYLSFGDNSQILDWGLYSIISHQYTSPGTYNGFLSLQPNPEYVANGLGECYLQIPFTIEVRAVSLDCKDCIGSFSPEPGKRYLIDAWVREDGAGPLVTNFSKPALALSFYDMNGVITNLTSMQAKGEIIDGWQRIEEEFVVPYNAVGITIQMKCTSGNCLFDDIRVFPYDGMMKGYVYDPLTLKLVAELDERNYATFYEYDEEGKLIRVKKETERGIMTIKENRNHSSNK